MACKQDGSLCYVLHSTEIEKPRAIALDPAEGLMYWSDWGDTAAGLYRSGMDGSRRIAMISKDIKWPNGIAIDHTTDRLYWCDAQLERIEYVSLDGRARKIVLQYHVPNPYSLAVFEDTLYWSDWATLSLNSCNKFTGHNQTIIARANGKHIMGVHVYHPVLKKTKTTSSCHSNGGCSHLCLLTPEGRSCACPAEMLLSNDSATCETPPQRCPTNDFRCSNGRCILRSWLCDFRDDCGDNSDESDCSAPTGCAVDQFPCDNGECAQSLWRCDGEPDCADGSDESACHSTTCHDHQLRCDHGQCIPTSWVCDGAKDCLDGTDERNCFLNVPTCNEGQFRCDDGECIYKHEVCDGHDDCTKAEDELNCTAKAECSSEDFYCSDPRRCMPRRWLCDGDDDCADAFDEANCHRNRTPVAREGCEQFSCQSGECLPWSKVCDDYPNCGDSSDEGGSCSSSCQGGNGGCSQNCHKMPAGSRCSCFTGFELMPDGKTCEDIDECQVPGNCSQYCTNTKGSFKCACAPGYFLELDHKRCKADGGAATLMYLLPDQIKGIDLVSRAQRVYVSGGVTDMRGMDYDASEEIYFWTEWKESEIGFYTADTNRREILLRTLRQPNFLKWDYIAKNIYYTDSEGSILACRRDGKFCTIVVDRPASHINSLELDPMSGLMFWSVWSVVLKKSLGVIERAEMDGTKRTVIVSNNIYWPTAINVDRVLKYIYWTDAKLNRIEYADFNGLNRKEIVRDIPYYPFSMALFEDKVFWSDWGTDTIRHCNRFTGKNCATFHEGGVKAETIMIVHKAQQPKEENRCENAGCSHMCLLTRSGHSCRCAEGYQGLDSSCEFNATTPRPTTPQPQCPEGYCMRDAPCEMVDSYKLCKCQEPFDGARCEKYMVGMEPAYDYTWVVAVAIGLGMIVAIIIVVYLLGRKKRSMTQTALTVNLSAGRCTIQEIQLSSASSKLEKV